MNPQLSLFDLSPGREATAYGHELSPEQARVRDAGAGHHVVVAGAGTGKTELLTQRVLKLLLIGAPDEGIAPADLEGVVALTFTNKAASEMRSRVYRALVRRLRSTHDESERARLSELRFHFAARNRIWTFDSLGATILRLFPEHSPLPRGATLPTAGQERALMRDLSRRFWASADTFSEDERERLFEFLELFDRRENALRAIRDAARRDTTTLQTLAKEPPFEEFAAGLLDAAQARLDAGWQAHRREVETLEALSPRHRATLLDAGAVFLPARGGGFLTHKGFAAAFARELEGVPAQALKRLAERLIAWKTGSLELAERKNSLLLCEEGAPPVGEWEREWRGRRAVATLARYGLWWQNAERSLKDERKLASFDDITRAALEVFDVPAVQSALREEIAWLLVDEFQDTNPAQWRVVQSLRRRAPALGNTLLVGDPKQAIYDFRGGDIRVFDRGRAELEREGARVSPLSISRRSAPPLVAWTNRVFASVFPREGGPREPFEAEHGPLTALPKAWAKPRAGGDEPGVFVLRPLRWRAPNAPAPAAMLTEAMRLEAAHALASWLLELLADARDLDTERAPRQPRFASVARAMAGGEPAVAVLFSDNSVKSVFEEVLRARGVPFVSVRGRGFFRCDAVRWSVALWRALLDEDDEAAWVGLLRSPLGGQSDVSLLERHAARQSEDEWMPTNPLDRASQEALRERLASWSALAGIVPISQLMERVLDESEIAFFDAACEDAAQREENWRKVIELVRQREDEDEGGLRALVDFFEAHADDDGEPLAPLPAGGAIQLLTVHASKGLGFPCCVLAQTESPKRDGGDKTVLWGEPGTHGEGGEVAAFSFSRERDEEEGARDKAPLSYNLLRQDAAARALAEWKRLFYVACTRAQSHLVVLETNGNAPETSWHAFARDALTDLPELLPGVGETPHLPAFAPQREQERQSPPAPPQPLATQAAREAAFDDLFGKGAELPLARQRTWLEARLRERGADAAQLQQDVPFSARGALLEQASEWIIGVWPWLAPLEDGRVLLAATGASREAAHRRAKALQLIAEESGLKVGQAFALWSEAGEVAGETC